jgi:hypothetical protein
MLSKVHREILVSLGLVQNFEISHLSMAKVETIIITVTYPSYFDRVYVDSDVKSVDSDVITTEKVL